MYVPEWRVIAAVLLAIWGASCGPAARKWVDVPVPSFEFNGRDLKRGGVLHVFQGDVGEAAIILAQQVKVPICFEPVVEGREVTPFPIEVKAENTTVGGMLDAMIRQDTRYEYRERLGVIELRPVGAAEDSKSCLNMRIPVFRVQYPWTIALGSLRCQIANVSESNFNLVYDPMREGCAGRLPGFRPKNERTIHATFLFEPARVIADRIVAEAGGAGWTAYYSKPSRACDSLIISAYPLNE